MKCDSKYVDRMTVVQAIEILYGKNLKWHQKLEINLMIWTDMNRIKEFFAQLQSDIYDILKMMLTFYSRIK
jgi:hypothetical protein